MSTVDDSLNYHTFKPISLLDVTLKDLVFGDDEMVIVLLLFRGTNRGRRSFKLSPTLAIISLNTYLRRFRC